LSSLFCLLPSVHASISLRSAMTIANIAVAWWTLVAKRMVHGSSANVSW
jgi:hypothetical protein